MDKEKIKALLIALPIQILTLIGLYFLFDYFQLPFGLTGALLMFVFMGIFTIMGYKKFKMPQKVAFIGLIIGSGLLSFLFAYDHFIDNIRITVIHIGIILFIPIAIGNYLMKKQKEKT